MNWFKRKRKENPPVVGAIHNFVPMEGAKIAKMLNDLLLDYQSAHPGRDPFDYILGIAMDTSCFLQLKHEVGEEDMTHFMSFPIGLIDAPMIVLVQKTQMADFMESQREKQRERYVGMTNALSKDLHSAISEVIERVITRPASEKEKLH